ncbi:MAG TPA: acyl-CoA dehydrogenase family protein, partial [Candidatus Acidoferrales bacterium]|nr:acyl-CoA dehydrogenase family protein [Candidatus Acidoferrales bacterium]
MTTYKAPLRDYRFVLTELFDVGELAKLPGYEEATPDLFESVLEEGAKLCEGVLLPLNRSGDEEGCTFENGVVRTPKGFKEAYDTFRRGGWTALGCEPEHGGQGLPRTLHTFVEEMICATNLAFGMYPGLSYGAYNALEEHGTEALKQRYLPKLADGTWSGTMCLTEPHCGTDLGQIRTKAEPTGDGGVYKITGTKIFISAGEHDLADNILHLVLAKIPGGPPGTRGISLFLVPKFLSKDDGALGPRNGMRCGSIEHKMGIKASSTCVMNFDAAEGYLVGEAHKGMRAMFTMMNGARLGVGIQGLGLGETAYQTARAYAAERLQGRSVAGAKFPEKPADPIIVHPDVRRMLFTMRAWTEGARALAAWVAIELDKAIKHPDPAEREAADDFVSLMTPIVKSMFTDNGFACANLGMQVMGGHGYIREWGMEQLVRDCRITQIYEGTNGIQALDLVGRKLPSH